MCERRKSEIHLGQYVSLSVFITDLQAKYILVNQAYRLLAF